MRNLDQIFQKRENHEGFLQQHPWHPGSRGNTAGSCIFAVGCLREEHHFWNCCNYSWNRTYWHSYDAQEGDRNVTLFYLRGNKHGDAQ